MSRRQVLGTGLLIAVVAVTATAQSPASASSALRAAAAKLPRLYSLLASQRGQLTIEYYAKGHGPTRLANIKSASKSVISTLVGIALERKHIPSLDTPIVRWFPELRGEADSRKQRITVDHLLTMQTGLESTSGGDYGRWVASANWVRYVLTRPMVSDPGTTMEYSTGTSHLLSALLTKATGRSTHQFASEVLGNEMQMTPPQMLALGELYLARGRAGGRQVVPAAWIDRSCTPRTRSRWDADREYGYGWWIRELGGHRACFAWGFGGQYIMVFSELDLVVAITSSPSVSDERRGYRRQLFDLLEQHVLDPVRRSPSQTSTSASSS
jgi:CubicO group peptidase (beta-lactamase class C family)